VNRRCIVLVLLLGAEGSGCFAGGAEHASDAEKRCRAEGPRCLNAETTTHDVAGLHVIHKRTKGDLFVSMHVFFDNDNRTGPRLWAEDVALDLLASGKSSGLGGRDLQETLDDLRAYFFSFSGLDYGVAWVSVPRENWLAAWTLLARSIMQPSLDQALVANYRNNTLADYGAEFEQPDQAATTTAWSGLVQGHRYDRARETLSALKQLSAASTAAAWLGLRTQERMWIVVVGDVSWEELRQPVTQPFLYLPLHLKPTHGADDGAPPSINRTAVLDFPDSQLWYIHAFFFGPSASDPDYPALGVALEILDRRLNDEVRDARGLAYSVGVQLDRNRQTAGELYVTTDMPAVTLAVVQRVVMEELQDPPEQAEIDAARQLLTTRLLKNGSIPAAIADTLGHWQLVAGDRLEVDRFIRELHDVTPARALQVLRRYLHSASIAAAGAGAAIDDSQLRALIPDQGPDAPH
jgi:predicted Zn-dependent peptidase